MNNNNRRRNRKSSGDKPLGRPTYNPEYVLTKKQISFCVAALLTDGWLSFGKTYKNPSIGFELAKRSESLVNFFVDTLQDLITAKPLLKRKGARSSSADKKFENLQIRTVSHPQFHQFVKAFGGHGKNKTVPSVSYLMETVTWEALDSLQKVTLLSTL